LGAPALALQHQVRDVVVLRAASGGGGSCCAQLRQVVQSGGHLADALPRGRAAEERDSGDICACATACSSMQALSKRRKRHAPPSAWFAPEPPVAGIDALTRHRRSHERRLVGERHRRAVEGRVQHSDVHVVVVDMLLGPWHAGHDARRVLQLQLPCRCCARRRRRRRRRLVGRCRRRKKLP
jgi:hypothetical protein